MFECCPDVLFSMKWTNVPRQRTLTFKDPQRRLRSAVRANHGAKDVSISMRRKA